MTKILPWLNLSRPTSRNISRAMTAHLSHLLRLTLNSTSSTIKLNGSYKPCNPEPSCLLDCHTASKKQTNSREENPMDTDPDAPNCS
jgi:hypothetical protein